MAVTFALRPISPVVYNEGFRYYNRKITASNTLKKGAPVTLVAPGTLTEATAASATSNVTNVLGFVTADGSQYDWKDDTFGLVDPSLPVALSHAEFRGSLKGTFAANDVGTAYGLKEQTGDLWTLDRTLTATSGSGGENQTSAVVIGVEDGVAVGDIDVPVRFVVIPARRQVIS